jgi:hypothetical protein
VLQAHRARLHTWRKLPARDQALLVLAHLRNGDTYTRLAAGFGVGLATACRYVREAVAVLGRTGPQPDRRAVGAGLDAQQLRPARRHRRAHQPDLRPQPAVLLRPAQAPRVNLQGLTDP